MTVLPHLWVFFALVFGICIVPGLDMAYILGSIFAGGLRAGLTAIAGIMTAVVWHVTVGVTGIAVLIKVIPGAYEVLLIGGALYIVWIGFNILRSEGGFAARATSPPRSPWATFRGAMVTNMLNPKAYLFVLAVFPQFVHPELGPLWFQAVQMWLVITLNIMLVYGSFAVAAAHTRTWLDGREGATTTINRVIGLLLIGGGVAAVIHGWPG
ncbi:MAG: LysE family translocator [Gammaproteobacteria bacterium]|jgi:threonine/homoserine/homoserine lactone efflux protein